MAISRKRKHTAEEGAVFTKVQPNTTGSADVGKCAAMDTQSKKRKTQQDDETTAPLLAVSAATPASAKSPSSKDGFIPTAKNNATVQETQAKKRTREQSPEDSTSSTPRSKRHRTALPPTPAETPSKATAMLFDRLNLSSTKAIPFSFDNRTVAGITPPDTPDTAERRRQFEMPSQLDELCQLHAAFLAALALYYSHNGTTSPIGISELLALVTKHWKKRSVTLEDIRLLLAVSFPHEATFSLQDYGRAGISLSKAEPRGRALKRAASYIDEDELNSRFEDALRKHWSRWCITADKENISVETFLAQLPRADVTINESAQKASALGTRGKERLTDIRNAQKMTAQATTVSSASATNGKTSSPTVQNRGTSLLDRILARQALAASSPTGPTREQMERRAALHRIEEIARVLGLLVCSKPRVSLSMSAMAQQLQQSLRNPISISEVDRCLQLMATEITPGFVSIIVSVAVKAVVVNRAFSIGAEELKARVSGALANAAN